MTLIKRIGKAVLSVLLASAGLTLVVYALGRLLAPEIPVAARVYDAALLRETEALRDVTPDPANPPVLQRDVDYAAGAAAARFPKGQSPK